MGLIGLISLIVEPYGSPKGGELSVGLIGLMGLIGLISLMGK